MRVCCERLGECGVDRCPVSAHGAATGTFEELGYAMRHSIPMYLLKMAPRWSEAKAALILENLQADDVRLDAASCVPDLLCLRLECFEDAG